MHQQVVEGSPDLHSSHHLLALPAQQQQAMALVQQHSKAAMPLVQHLSKATMPLVQQHSKPGLSRYISRLLVMNAHLPR